MTIKELESVAEKVNRGQYLQNSIQELNLLKDIIKELPEKPMLGFCFDTPKAYSKNFFFKDNLESTREIMINHIDFQISYYESEFGKL